MLLSMHDAWQTLATLQKGQKEEHHHPCYPVIKNSVTAHKHENTLATTCKQGCLLPCEAAWPAGPTQAGILMSPNYILPDTEKNIAGS